MKITTDILVIGTGCSAATAASWLVAMQSALDGFEINTPRRIGAFLANVGIESNGLRVFEENLNYSSQGLANTWPNRYAQSAHTDTRVPNELAMGLGGRPVDIANNVYADRLGNGHSVTGDGWKYRGVGPIQITGKTNQTACMAALQFDPATDGDFNVACHAPILGSLSAAWFFADYAKCNPLADMDQFSNIVKAINGQLPCAANRGPDRLKAYSACVAACNALVGPVPVVPSKPSPTPAKKAALPPAKA